jgi:hypothetical protein
MGWGEPHGIDDRGTGKTTGLIEEAIRLVGEMPETHRVFITGAHSQWLHQLEREFRATGLVGVVFLSPHQICRGALRGMKGVLLVDDPWDLPAKVSDTLYLEKLILERGS